MPYFAKELASITQPGSLVEEGLAVVEGDTLKATELGHFFIRRLAMAFDAYLSQPSSEERPRFSQTI